jgi:hypothetical protein
VAPRVDADQADRQVLWIRTLVGTRFDPFVVGAMIILIGIVTFMTEFVGQ